MKSFELIVDMIGKVIWPLVTVVIFFALRKPISNVLSGISKIKYQGVEVDFSSDLAAVQKNAYKVFGQEINAQKKLLIDRADKLPNSAILDSWEMLHESAENLLLRNNITTEDKTSTRFKVVENELTKNKIVETKKMKIFGELRQLRNKVAHAQGFQVNRTEALQYIELCFLLIEHLDSTK